MRDLCLELAGWMLQLGGAAGSVEEGKRHSAQLISSGAALEKFGQMVKLQGGDARVIDDVKRLPQSKYTTEVKGSRSGYVVSMQCEQIGTACVILGGGRERKEDSVDPSVGIVLHKKIGDQVEREDCSPRSTTMPRIVLSARARLSLPVMKYQTLQQPPGGRLVHRVIGSSGERN